MEYLPPEKNIEIKNKLKKKETGKIRFIRIVKC